MDRRGILGMGLLAWLAACWKPAAADTGGWSDVAEFRRHIMTMLRDRGLAENLVADSADPAKFRMTVHGEGSTVTVANLFASLEAYPDENSSEVIDRFIRSITADHNAQIGDGDIVAVIRTRDYAGSMGPQFLREPLSADLVIVYMADRPDALETLAKTDLPGKSLADVRRLALGNLRKWLPRIVSDSELGDGVLYTVEGNEMLSTSLILLEEFWKSVAGRFPGDVLIALPCKDQLFLFDDTPLARPGVRRLIDATLEDNVNLLSPQLYARRGGKIVVVSD